MNIILTLTSILIFAFSLLPAQVHAAANTYYVTQNGNGARSGVSLGNAWSVSDFNSSANWSTSDHSSRIDPGDTVYFSGTITSQIAPPAGYGGSSGKYVTLDGWESGTCDPVANSGCASAAVLDRPSRTSSISNWCMLLIDNSYLIVQDFEMQDSHGGITGSGPDNSTRPTHLTIRRNYMHDMEGRTVQMTAFYDPDYEGYDYITFGGALGDGNFVWDGDQNAKTAYSDSHTVGFANSNDLVVSYNRMENDPADQDLGDASNILSIHTSNRFLVEYNTIGYPHGQACFAKKEFGGDDGIIRFNKFYGCGQQGLAVVTGQGPQTDYYIYGNLIYNSAGGIFLYRNYDRIHIWSNLIHNISPEGGSGQGGYPIQLGNGWKENYPNTDQGDVYIYNNTVSRGDMSGVRGQSSGIAVSDLRTANVRIKNNIAYYNNSDGQDVQIDVNGAESDVSIIDYNTVYSNGPSYIYCDSAKRTASYTNTKYSVSNNKESDPGFTDPNGTDDTYGTVDDEYTLDGTNINDGADLSQCFDVSVQGRNYHMCYNDALDPGATDWGTNPPTVRTTKQENYSSWERGAYVYTGDGPMSPTAPSSPSLLRILNSN